MRACVRALAGVCVCACVWVCACVHVDDDRDRDNAEEDTCMSCVIVF